LAKAYIAVSYTKRQSLSNVLNCITTTLKEYSIESVIFVDQYQFTATAEKQMMQQAMAAIDDCDILIAETSDKAIGIGAEVGYAKAKGKPVIYMRHADAAHSTTISGISDFQIVYYSNDDLKLALNNVITQLIKL
jgi:2'-deoxynucleoside 5'-phosphate N-hydrolase